MIRTALIVCAVASVCTVSPALADDVGVRVGPGGVTVHADRDRDRDRDKTVIINRDRDRDADRDKTVIINRDRDRDRRPGLVIEHEHD